jgi:flagellar assembly factor FliW
MSEIKNGRIIAFPKGIPGFEEHKTYVFCEEEGSPLVQMESATDRNIGFILLRPQLYLPEYLPQVELSDEEAEALDLAEEDTVEVWAIITLSLSDVTKSTVNLRAPILVNNRTARGIQYILNDDSYSSRQLLFVQSQDTCQEQNASKEGAVG